MSDSVWIAGYALSRIIHRIQNEIYFGIMYTDVHFVPRKTPYLPSLSSGAGNQRSKKDWKNHAHGPFVRFSSTYQQLE
jgi:hypothetical protein